MSELPAAGEAFLEARDLTHTRMVSGLQEILMPFDAAKGALDVHAQRAYTVSAEDGTRWKLRRCEPREDRTRWVGWPIDERGQVIEP